MTVIEFAAGNPGAAILMVVVIACAVVGLVDRVAEPARIRARARLADAQARESATKTERVRIRAASERAAAERAERETTTYTRQDPDGSDRLVPALRADGQPVTLDKAPPRG